jgi:hypothetical protein
MLHTRSAVGKSRLVILILELHLLPVLLPQEKASSEQR